MTILKENKKLILWTLGALDDLSIIGMISNHGRLKPQGKKELDELRTMDYQPTDNQISHAVQQIHDWSMTERFENLDEIVSMLIEYRDHFDRIWSFIAECEQPS